MNKILFFVITSLVSVISQLAIGDLIAIKAVVPILGVALVVIWSFWGDFTESLYFAAIMGLFYDLISDRSFGPFVISFVVIVILVFWSRKMIVGLGKGAVTLITIAVTALFLPTFMMLMDLLFYRLPRYGEVGPQQAWEAGFAGWIILALYTFFLSLILFKPFGFVVKKVIRFDKINVIYEKK